MESDRRLRKVCPQCDTAVHVRRAVCGCGHAFLSKRRAQCTPKEEGMKRTRTLESEQDRLVRKDQDKLRKESMRGAETNDETLHRQEWDR